MALIYIILLLGLTYQCRAVDAQEHKGNLTEACFDNSTCIDTNNTVCDASKCLTKYGKPCQNTMECVSNAECANINTSNTCNCKQGFTNQILGTCGLIFNASCGASNATFCGTGLICDADKCIRKLGEQCTQSNECVQNAECSTTCKCKSGYVQQSGLCSGSNGGLLGSFFFIIPMAMFAITLRLS